MDENVAGAHIANITGIDPENDELAFSIVESQGNAHLFMIMNNMLHLKNDVVVDFEVNPKLEVTLRASDPGELSINQSFTIVWLTTQMMIRFYHLVTIYLIIMVL